MHFKGLTYTYLTALRRSFEKTRLACCRMSLVPGLDSPINNTATNECKTDDGEETLASTNRENVRSPVIRLALKLMYVGQHYKGMQYQGNNQELRTVEGYLLSALEKSGLIKDRNSCRYVKSSRTDGGVSAISQVVAFDVQENFQDQLKERRKLCKRLHVGRREVDNGQEVNIPNPSDFLAPVHHINSLLPSDIKVLALAIVPENFIPRLKNRKTYKYWFLKADLDLEVMSNACKRFEGLHDFRNLSTLKYDKSYVCNISSATITESEHDPRVAVFTVTGNRFLMHQIRWMVGILKLIGSKKEKPEVIDELFDVETNPTKPQYQKASGLFLCLFKTEYMEDIKWVHHIGFHHHITKKLQKELQENILMAGVRKDMLDELNNTEFETDNGVMKRKDIIASKCYNTHKPIMSTQRGSTIEDAKKKYERKMRKKEVSNKHGSDVASYEEQVLGETTSSDVVCDEQNTKS